MKLKDVLLLTRKPELYSSRRLVQAAIVAGFNCTVRDPEAEDFGQPLVVFPRLGSYRFNEALARLSRIGTDVKFINSPIAYQKSRNKWLCIQALENAGIATPPSQLIAREEFAFVKPSFPFVLKDLFSGKGTGIFLIKDEASLSASLHQMPESNLFLVQDFISECFGEDLRVFVTRTGDYWSMLRKNSEGDFRSNLNLGGKPLMAKAETAELEAAFAALNIFGLDYAGVDVLRSHDGPLMIEVNPCPGLEGIESIHGQVIAEKIIALMA